MTRHTLNKPFTLTGKSLHAGKRTTLTLRPAPENTGIRFRRTDLETELTVAPDHARRATLSTALDLPGGHRIRTIEHLLSACMALGLDDLIAEIDTEELPILDGSAAPICAAIQAAGLVATAAPRPHLRVLAPIEVSTPDDRLLRVEPADTLTFDITLDLAHWGMLRWSGTPLGATYLSEIAPARSFLRLGHGLAQRLKRGQGEPVLRGAWFTNTAPLFRGGILGGARLPAEPVRHRALDLLGDLALLGMPLLGHVTAHRTGHALNLALVQTIMARPDAWVILPS
ncbi:UDP-3-O-acyl-N-acetylglucosamine deacetylase [Plastoroseomonas arctica]|uniref:UDP-3-O-acyl-N-acetylglucosamine deacetylase n=1 Tax=Plastoroseomonas arctica TaxID=1509237 RepID=A0AAF1KJC8_9PROT|nr:UDP-3-O-acyl-N-acetylglucosamine deacetylase [Plastoroseomonas arctica]MBR0654855.1 UDP-3-O-[3-hydroxymyristoyl] N-acetylglucosamine deacetylase [Plastoroseomonas arctica]